MGRREELLRREAEGWDRVAALVDELTPEQQERPGLSPDGWSVRDLLWHLGFWYEDDLVRTDAGWRFARRHQVLSWRHNWEPSGGERAS